MKQHNPQDHPSTDQYDVFISYNSKDRPDVTLLAEVLMNRGLRVWFDQWQLKPGDEWMKELEKIIRTCKSAAVCMGPSGLGAWEEPEMRSLLDRFVNEKKAGKFLSVIPILLPQAPDNVELPMFLRLFTWTDLRGGLTEEAIDKLQWGITGKKPEVD